MNQDDFFGNYLNDRASQEPMSDKRDEKQLKIAQLVNDQQSIKNTLQSYGVPSIGDLFSGRAEDVEATVNSIYFMMKQRVADVDFKNDVRTSMNKKDQACRDLQDANSKLRSKVDSQAQQLKDLELQLKNAENRAKQEKDRLQAELTEVNKQITRVQSKETQLKHELRGKETMILKLQETVKQKLSTPKTHNQPSMDLLAPAQQNQEFKFSKISGESDFHLMVSKDQDDIYQKMRVENQELKEALKLLQKELLEIVVVKHDSFVRRYKAEYGAQAQPGQETEDALSAHIETIRDELFNQNFEESGKELVAKFRHNFQRLREFMHTIDKEIGSLQVFNANGDAQKAVDLGVDNPNDSYSDITSVQQLRHLLRNYEALVESQHHLLTQSITKMGKIPPPEEISQTFERFQVLKEGELDDFRQFLDEQKSVLQSQYRDFEGERRIFNEMTNRADQEKARIAGEREKVESEVRRIRELNQQLQAQLSLGSATANNA